MKENKYPDLAGTMCELNRIADAKKLKPKTETMDTPKKRRFPEGTLQAYHETYNFLARRGWTKADRFGRETWNKRVGELTYVLPMDQAVEWEVADARDAAKTRREGPRE